MGSGASSMEPETEGEIAARKRRESTSGLSFDVFESLPEKVTAAQVSEVVGDKFAERLMRSFSIDGLLDKNSTIKAMSQSVDNEVYNLFLNYTTSCIMDEAGFLNLLRDCRILSKQDLSAHYAKLMYKEETTRFEDSLPTVNFAAFRNRLLPLVAEKKNLTLDQLMSKLAHYEENTHPELYERVEAASSIRIQTDNMAPPIQTTDDQAKAAMRVQSMARKNNAKKKMVLKRQLSRAASVEIRAPPPRAGGFTNPDTGEPYTEDEITFIMSRSFETYITCSPTLVQFKGQMNRYQFVHLCFDAGLITPAFPLNLCQAVFDESIATASNPSTGREYNEGIFYNKRLNFFIFRTIVFTILATRTGLSTDELFVKLTSGLPEKPSTFKEEKIQGDRRSSNARLFIDLNTMFDNPDRKQSIANALPSEDKAMVEKAERRMST